MAVILLTISNCDETVEQQKLAQEKDKRDSISIQERMFSNIQTIKYFKDERPKPPICYAYIFQHINTYSWGQNAGNNSIGGPALATVDCESVKDLISIKGMDEDFDLYKRLKIKYEK